MVTNERRGRALEGSKCAHEPGAKPAAGAPSLLLPLLCRDFRFQPLQLEDGKHICCPPYFVRLLSAAARAKDVQKVNRVSKEKGEGKEAEHRGVLGQ